MIARNLTVNLKKLEFPVWNPVYPVLPLTSLKVAVRYAERAIPLEFSGGVTVVEFTS